MQWVGYAELASAVSNAGGLGIVNLPRPGEQPQDALTKDSSSLA